MSVITYALIRVLETIFVFGIVGAALVVILTSIEDVRDVLSNDNGERSGERQGEMKHRASTRLADHSNFASMQFYD